HREVPGKKTWTWGNDDAGNIWINKLTDADGQYVEFQAGRFETQMEHEFIAPHRVERFTEYWFPLHKLGKGFDAANQDVALSFAFELANQQSVALQINASAVYEDAEVAVLNDEGQGKVAKVKLAPDLSTSHSFPLAPSDKGKP